MKQFEFWGLDMKLKSVYLFVLLLASSALWAANGYRYYYPAPNFQQTPSRILDRGLFRLQNFLAREKPNKKQLKAFVENEIGRYFDFDYMAKWAAGRFYKELDAYQKEQMVDTIKDMFFNTLTRALSGKDLPSIRVLRERAGRYSNEIDVTALVYQGGSNSRPLKMTFRLYKSKNGWKIFDVMAKGRSAIQFYRSYFKKMFRRMKQENLL